ncbi:hypothetical protein [Kribbella sp. NPDC000426]|uniref:hypothetical protein n=1 Tax=Kribbella sp. NPDC000426 TaxID=3154255 RepID=UPI0033246FB6
MHRQVGHAVVAGGEVAGRAPGQPNYVAVGKRLLVVGCTNNAATSDDDEYYVEIRFGVGVHAMTGA